MAEPEATHEATPEARLAELGIVLPQPVAAIAAYTPFVRTGNLLVISGQLPMKDGALVAKGLLGGGVSIEDGQAAARQCAINLLAQIKLALGDLSKVVQVVRLGGFIACTPDFTQQADVMNGASLLMQQVFADKGVHARSTIGVSALPLGAVVEVEALLEVVS